MTDDAKELEGLIKRNVLALEESGTIAEFKSALGAVTSNAKRAEVINYYHYVIKSEVGAAAVAVTPAVHKMLDIPADWRGSHDA